MNSPIQLYATGATPIYDPSREEVVAQEEELAQQIVDLGWSLHMKLNAFMIEAFAWKNEGHQRTITSNYIGDVEEKPNAVLNALKLIKEEIMKNQTLIFGVGAQPFCVKIHS